MIIFKTKLNQRKLNMVSTVRCVFPDAVLGGEQFSGPSHAFLYFESKRFFKFLAKHHELRSCTAHVRKNSRNLSMSFSVAICYPVVSLRCTSSRSIKTQRIKIETLHNFSRSPIADRAVPDPWTYNSTYYG